MRPSLKTQLVIFLCGFALFLAIKEADELFALSTILAVICSVSAEAIFSFLKNKKFVSSSSAVISGLIIGFVLSSDSHWWITASAALLAIASKYFIRVNDRHIFNPAAFGVFAVTILFGSYTQWKGTYLWYILVPFGLYFTYRIRKLEILFGYGITALLLFGLQAILRKNPLFDVFRYLSYFFIFIMLVEPKTTPAKLIPKALFGFGIAVSIFILTSSGVKFDPEISSLLLFNLAVPLLNRIPERRA